MDELDRREARAVLDGGDLDEVLACYWTKVEYMSSYAWYVPLHYGNVNYTTKYSTHRVRPVSRVAEAAI